MGRPEPRLGQGDECALSLGSPPSAPELCWIWPRPASPTDPVQSWVVLAFMFAAGLTTSLPGTAEPPAQGALKMLSEHEMRLLLPCAEAVVLPVARICTTHAALGDVVSLRLVGRIVPSCWQPRKRSGGLRLPLASLE